MDKKEFENLWSVNAGNFPLHTIELISGGSIIADFAFWTKDFEEIDFFYNENHIARIPLKSIIKVV